MFENLPNDEVFRLYDVELVLRHRSPKSLKEARRIVGHLRSFLGEYPPSPELAKSYLIQFIEREPRTQERYAAELRSFMKWYGEPLDLKVPLSRSLPKYVLHDAVMRLLDAISGKSSHKRTMVRDCLIVELAYYAGLRRAEMANLTAGEIRFAVGFVTVRKGKGQKDRVVPLTKSLAAKLERFCRDMTPDQKVLGLKEATITNKIAVWSKKAGVELSCHSLRHGFATRLLEKGADMRAIQELLGHESLNTTQIYANLAPDSLRQAIDLLDEPVSKGRSIRADQASLDGGSRPVGPSVTVDSGLHHRELVYFGLCLRDRLSLCLPHETAECVCGDRLLMWRGRPGPEASRRGGQESVEREWTVGRYDATTHSLFDWFKAHLADHPCWEALDEVALQFRDYAGACQRAYTAVIEEVKDRAGHLKESDARGMAESLLLDAYYAVAGSSQRLQFSYEPKSVPTEEGIRWYLQLGSWGVGYEEDPEELQPIAEVHRDIGAGLLKRAELRALVEADVSARAAMKAFQVALSPDARLRKLVLGGRCELCP